MNPIAVTERLPDIGMRVLAYDADMHVWCIATLGKQWRSDELEWTADAHGVDGLECEVSTLTISHWQPLPDHP